MAVAVVVAVEGITAATTGYAQPYRGVSLNSTSSTLLTSLEDALLVQKLDPEGTTSDIILWNGPTLLTSLEDALLALYLHLQKLDPEGSRTSPIRGPLAELVEDSPLSKEVETIQEEEAGFLVGSEQLLTNQEAQTDLKEDGRDFPLSTIVTEKVDVENEKVLSGADAVGDQLSKEALMETGKVAEEDGARTLETEEGSEKRNVIPEEIILRPVTEGVNSSISSERTLVQMLN
ncbi:hypothetical protein CJ030_MR0G007881 [Morella rubra]|uniref:Uncharacterized protein n=1 Tax=Morella rubra TaxID=262757 RepID=A0A6A1UM10_9ROSI|nr:hypothetical protein CJ030_MR0G007881 [Morella rubra]